MFLGYIFQAVLPARHLKSHNHNQHSLPRLRIQFAAQCFLRINLEGFGTYPIEMWLVKRNVDQRQGWAFNVLRQGCTARLFIPILTLKYESACTSYYALLWDGLLDNNCVSTFQSVYIGLSRGIEDRRSRISGSYSPDGFERSARNITAIHRRPWIRWIEVVN